MSYSGATIWAIILATGLGTYAIRLSFLGLFGGRQMPDWLLRHLRYAPMAVLPALVAPLVIWPAATGGELDPARLIATAAALGAGILSRNTLLAIAAGLGTLYLGLWLLG